MDEKELRLLLLLATSCSQLLYYYLKKCLRKENEEKFGVRSDYGKETF